MDKKKLWDEFEKSLLNYDKDNSKLIMDKYIFEYDEISFIEEMLYNVFLNIEKKWDEGELSLSHLYLSSIICEELLTYLEEKREFKYSKNYNIAIVTLEDNHALGKRIVSSILRSNGYLIEDFGHGIHVMDIITKIIEFKTKILLVSVLMYPSALKVKELKEELKRNNLDTKIIVGGAPFIMDNNLWKYVEADAFGITASDSIALIAEMTKEAD